MFRPAKRENTPLIVGLAGPTKSGKTYSAQRLARGLCLPGKRVAMINAEGARGHQYADEFEYIACDIAPPFRPGAYEKPILELIGRDDIGCAIVDSMSHMHDGPGGMLEWHDEIQKKMAKRGTNNEREYEAKLERVNMAAWIDPKAAENAFVYRILELACPVILCFRAKEKIKVVPGKPPVDLGWQPISSDRVAFETLFTLMLPPHSEGVPDLALSDMRKPFDTMVPRGKAIDEKLGAELRAWSAGAAAMPVTLSTNQRPAGDAPPPTERGPSIDGGVGTALRTADIAKKIGAGLELANAELKARFAGMLATYNVQAVVDLSPEQAKAALRWLNRRLDEK